MSKQRRLSKIFAKDGKSVTLALDGYFSPPKLLASITPSRKCLNWLLTV